MTHKFSQVRIRAGLVFAVVVAVAALTIAGPPAAHADRVNREALDELMSGFRFGMTRAQAMAKIRRDVKERYDKKIFASSDVYQHDKLRRERDQEIARIESSYVTFEGEVAGWDVSVIDDQFIHNTGESMMVYWESVGNRNQRRFFFFQDDRLYKMVLTLDVSVIEKSRRTFDVFRPTLERQYGPARDHERGLVWISNDYTVFALDKLLHYDTICLVIADKALSRKVLQLRAAREKKVDKGNPIIRSMIGGEEEVDLNHKADTIDRILDKK